MKVKKNWLGKDEERYNHLQVGNGGESNMYI